ncbi:MAG: right-handed parallel beta-helix repeat-containing protein [Polyangiales bacterium]
MRKFPTLLAASSLVLLVAACTTIPPVPGAGGTGGEGGNGGTGGQTFPCTEQGIRNAIAAGGGPHSFECSGPTSVPTAAVILIDNAVILDGGGDLIVDGNDDHRVFEVASDTTAELRGMTITRGKSSVGAGVFIGAGADVTLTGCSIVECTADDFGTSAGIQVSERALLTLIASTISRNVAFAGGGISVGNGATADVLRSTISGNVAQDSVSGGISVAGRLTVTNSTLSGNSPGAIAVGPDSSTTLTSTTIDGVEPGSGVPTIFIVGAGALTMVNSVLSGSCDSDVVVSGGHNIESPGDTCGLGGVGDAVGVSASQLNLGALQQKGGPTQTHEPASGSVAIDAIDPGDCEVEDDQRGVARPQAAGCDVGAVEVVP